MIGHTFELPHVVNGLTVSRFVRVVALSPRERRVRFEVLGVRRRKTKRARKLLRGNMNTRKFARVAVPANPYETTE